MIWLFISFYLLIGTAQAKSFEGSYYGSWAETSWEYHFRLNGTFEFKSEGHFGNTFSHGQYHFSTDTLILISNLDNHPNFYPFMEKFLIDGDSCIISLKTGYDYCKGYYSETTTSEGSQMKIYNPSRERIPIESLLHAQQNVDIPSFLWQRDYGCSCKSIASKIADAEQEFFFYVGAWGMESMTLYTISDSLFSVHFDQFLPQGNHQVCCKFQNDRMVSCFEYLSKKALSKDTIKWLEVESNILFRLNQYYREQNRYEQE